MFDADIFDENFINSPKQLLNMDEAEASVCTEACNLLKEWGMVELKSKLIKFDLNIENFKVMPKLHHNTPWSVVENNWKATFDGRKNELENSIDKTITVFLADWPLFRNSEGHRLIYLDFDYMYPDASLGLFNKWEDFCKVIPKIFKEIIKDRITLKKFKDYEEICLEQKDVRDYYTIEFLNALLKPDARIKNSTTGKIWKPSISDSQQGLVCVVPSINDLKNILSKKKEFYHLKKKV